MITRFLKYLQRLIRKPLPPQSPQTFYRVLAELRHEPEKLFEYFAPIMKAGNAYIDLMGYRIKGDQIFMGNNVTLINGIIECKKPIQPIDEKPVYITLMNLYWADVVIPPTSLIALSLEERVELLESKAVSDEH